MEKKTIEEMRVAVLAECETVCKESMQCYGIGNGLKISKSSSQYVIEYQDDRGNWWILATINKYTESSDSLILVFYRLLGLSERDAVEAEKARLLKRYKARIKRLRADDAETHRIQMEVKDERIAALEAKNAALVAALEKIYAADNDPAIELIAKNALAANEKGGKGE